MILFDQQVSLFTEHIKPIELKQPTQNLKTEENELAYENIGPPKYVKRNTFHSHGELR